jgi:hypothetical protein
VKGIAGIMLGMQFAQRFGLFYSHLTGDNVVFNDEGLIQIYDFCVKSMSEVGGNSEAMADLGGFSGENCRSRGDVRAFAELLSRIVIGDSVEESGCSQSIPGFVLETN